MIVTNIISYFMRVEAKVAQAPAPVTPGSSNLPNHATYV